MVKVKSPVVGVKSALVGVKSALVRVVCFGRGDRVESRGVSRSRHLHLYRNSIPAIKIYQI